MFIHFRQFVTTQDLAKKKNFLIAGFLLVALGLTVVIAQKQTRSRQNAAELPSNITEEEKKVAGIDANGKLNEERAEDLAKFSPKGYEQLVQQELIANPNEVKNAIRPLGGAGGGGPTPIPVPPLTPPSISSCGDISTSGDYALTQDITAESACITIHDTQNVNLDCQNHTITATYSTFTGEGTALHIKNVQNFSIKNCSIQASPTSIGINIFNSNSGTIQNNTILKGYVNVYNTNNLQIANNTFKTHYQQTRSSNSQIHDNKLKTDPALPSDSAGVVISNEGNNNTIKNNVIDGSWDGVDHSGGLSEYTGADDGIILNDEKNDIVTGNTISNNWDCGIETVGFIQDTQFTNNRINNSGMCGIGGWYWNSWLHNTVDGNIVDGAAYMFFMFRVFINVNEQYVYFKDNTFTNNIFFHQRNNSYVGPTGNYSSWIDFYNIPVEIPLSKVQTGNNIFKNNNFDPNVAAPVIMPASMIVDQGSNMCLPVTDSFIRPLTCNNSPIPSPTSTSLKPINFELAPAARDASVGETFSINLNLNNSASYAISGVDTTIKFDNNILTLQSFSPSNFFSSKLFNTIDNANGTLRYSAVETQTAAKQATYQLGTLTFVGKSVGTGTLHFDTSQITAIGISGVIPTENNDKGAYIITQNNTTPTPVLPTPTPTSTLTGSCKVLYDKILSSFGKTCLNNDPKYDAAADLNKDKGVDGQDFSIFIKTTTNPGSPSAGVNQTACENYLSKTTNPCAITPTPTKGPVQGDADGDGFVTILDYNIWRDEFLGRLTTKTSDFNNDGKIDLLDFNIWRNAFNPEI